MKSKAGAVSTVEHSCGGNQEASLVQKHQRYKGVLTRKREVVMNANFLEIFTISMEVSKCIPQVMKGLLIDDITLDDTTKFKKSMNCLYHITWDMSLNGR